MDDLKSRCALGRIVWDAGELESLVPQPRYFRRWVTTNAGLGMLSYPDPLRVRRRRKWGKRSGREDAAGGYRPWGADSEYLALYRRDRKRARKRLLEVYHGAGGRIRTTANILGCSTNTVYAVIRRKRAGRRANRRTGSS